MGESEKWEIIGMAISREQMGERGRMSLDVVKWWRI